MLDSASRRRRSPADCGALASAILSVLSGRRGLFCLRTSYPAETQAATMDVLVAFVGLARSWRHLWREQHRWLAANLANATWVSVACIGETDEDGPHIMSEKLRIRRFLRVNISSTQPVCGVVPQRRLAGAKHDGGPHALLHRLSACSRFISQQCSAVGCTSLLYLRPDLHFSPPYRQLGIVSALAELMRPDSPRLQVFARVRCWQRIGGGRSFDDQLALVSRHAIPHYFQASYSTSGCVRRTTCAATASWSEGILTAALLSAGVVIKELTHAYSVAIYRNRSSWRSEAHALPASDLLTDRRRQLPCIAMAGRRPRSRGTPARQIAAIDRSWLSWTK